MATRLQKAMSKAKPNLLRFSTPQRSLP
jgi:hypothetical protein